MNRVYVKSLGISLSEEQIENLVRNARNLRNENIVLKEELSHIKEMEA